MPAKFLNSTDSSNFLNFQKCKKKLENSSQISFWAFLLSLLLYILVFYIFNLSTSTLLYTTRFWFFILNTLIFIIAADFGAFSSKEAELYKEYAGSFSNATKALDLVPFPLPNNDEITKENDCKEVGHEKPQEKIIYMICSSSTTESHDQTEENKHDIAFVDVENNASIEEVWSENIVTKNQEMIISQVKDDEAHAVKKRPRAKCLRRNSAKEMGSKIDDMSVLKRTMSDRHEELPKCEENDDEYSMMSDEELNRRVEEFIRRFNKQIRLQASQSRLSSC